jgi:hypothetical protein
MLGLFSDSLKMAVLCGSGISAPSGAPIGNQFARHVLKVCGADSVLEHISGQLPEHVPLRFEGLLEVLQRTVDKNLDIIDAVYFGTDKHKPEANRLHHHIARMARHCPVVTTNFDVLIEEEMRKLPDWTGWSDAVWSRSEWGNKQPDPGLWKIHGTARTFAHGDWRRDSSAEPAATLRHISRTRRDTNRKEFFKSVLANYALLVVGYSGIDDFDVSLWLRQFPCPRGVYWIAFAGRAEDGVKTLLEGRDRKPELGPVYVLNCEAPSTREKQSTIEGVLRIVANLIDPVSPPIAAVEQPRQSEPWKIAIDDWATEHVPSKWERDIVTAELLKHVSRFHDAIAVLSDTEKYIEPDPHRLAKTRLFLSEAEVEPGAKELRQLALKHARFSLQHYEECISCRPDDIYAAKIACAQALRLAEKPDPEGAADLLRSVLDDANVGYFERARAVFELDRLRRVGGTKYTADLALAKDSDIFVEAAFLHEQSKKMWPVITSAEALESDCKEMERAQELRTLLGDIRGLCATTNVLGQMYQALADWRGDSDSSCLETRQLARTRHLLSRDLAEKHRLYFDAHSAHASLASFHLRHDDSGCQIDLATRALEDARRYLRDMLPYEQLRFEYIESLLIVARQPDITAAVTEGRTRFAELASKWPKTDRPDQALALLKAQFNAELSDWRSDIQLTRLTNGKYDEILKIPYWKFMAEGAIAKLGTASTAIEWARLLLHPFR